MIRMIMRQKDQINFFWLKIFRFSCIDEIIRIFIIGLMQSGIYKYFMVLSFEINH